MKLGHWQLSRVKCQKSYLHSYSFGFFLRLYLIISIVIVYIFRQFKMPNDCYLNIHGFMAFLYPLDQLFGLDFLFFFSHTKISSFLLCNNFIHFMRLFFISSVNTMCHRSFNIFFSLLFLGYSSLPMDSDEVLFSLSYRFRYFISILCCHSFVILCAVFVFLVIVITKCDYVVTDWHCTHFSTFIRRKRKNHQK